MTQTHDHQRTLAQRLRMRTGLNPAKCYQCGKCSAGCPMADEMEFKAHDLMRLICADADDEIFNSESIWLCATCETCTARCPNRVDPARLIDGLRELALSRDPNHAPKAIRALNRLFLEQIEKHGRIFEMGLVMGYKLGGGPLFQDVMAAPGMLARGKLPLKGFTIKGRGEMKKIFAACGQEEDRP